MCLAVLLAALLIPAPHLAGAQREDYTAIDRHARKAPPKAQKSIAALAAYLSRGAKTKRQLARAIYVWITENLAYDYDNLATGKFEQRPEKVIRLKCTDCGGHSRLFEALA
jgi:transglutaminase-like putative cysteine protease